MIFDFKKFAQIAASVYPGGVYSLDDVLQVFLYYFEQYERHTGRPHPPIRASQIVRICQDMPYIDQQSKGGYDIICGTFFVAGLGVEDFVSLTEEQIRRYKEHYDRVMVLTAAKETTPQHKPPHPHKYRRGVER